MCVCVCVCVCLCVCVLPGALTFAGLRRLYSDFARARVHTPHTHNHKHKNALHRLYTGFALIPGLSISEDDEEEDEEEEKEADE